MGMREYDNGTVFFYEDEYDNKRSKDLTNQSFSKSSLQEPVDYDIDIINSLFESDPQK
jgi:hypothetical protein